MHKTSMVKAVVYRGDTKKIWHTNGIKCWETHIGVMARRYMENLPTLVDDLRL
jgi:hypothetical protein